MVGDEHTRSVCVEIVGHVVALFHHIGAHLVERRGGDGVALAVDLPGDGGVRRANGVVTGGTGGGSGVDGHVATHFEIGFDNHTLDEVGVVVGFIVDDDKDLGLDTDVVGNVLLGEGGENFHGEVAEDTIVERGLVLVGGTAGSSRRVGPVDFVGLSDFHGLVAVLPFVGLGVLLVLGVVEIALVSLAGLSGQLAAFVDFGRSAHVFLHQFTVLVVVALAIVLTGTVVLGSQVPVDVDGAETLLVVRRGDGDDIDLEATIVTLGDVSSGLGSDLDFGDIGTVVEGIDHALDIGEVDLRLVADIGSFQRGLGGHHVEAGFGRGLDG
mmetsp:Transcript_5818/g.12396  ORF Transcript_5818/g.12396 Transcript_5818/m.12396 type:complete len:325 (-) Transcript_5818:210-1184(-)